MATNVVDIDQVEPDIDPMAVGVVTNPLYEDFTHEYAGKPLTIPASTKKRIEIIEKEVENAKGEIIIKKEKKEIPASVGKKEFPLYVAVHLAHHLAQKIIRQENKDRIEKIIDKEDKTIESAKPIADYKGKCWEMMKQLVETDSDFFEEKNLGPDGMKERFTR